MARKTYPEYHKALLDQSVYPSASRRIKYQETATSHLYRTGDHLYKIRKPSAVYSSPAILEAFCHEALRLGQRWAPDVVEAVVPIVRRNGSYALGGEGEPVTFALRLRQLPGHYWLDELVGAEKLTPTAVGRLARYLGEHHKAHPADERAAEAGRPEHLRALIEAVSYQTKKYVGQTITEAMYEMMSRPIDHFLDEERKLFTRRMKKGHVVDGHGAFVPEHIYMKGKDVLAVAPLEAHPKFRVLDAANDLATLRNALSLAGAHETAELLLKRYVSATRDREVERMLPIYESFQAMRNGLMCSERMVVAGEGSPESKELAAQAHRHFNLAVQRARSIPRLS